MLPVLRASAHGEARVGEVVDSLGTEFRLSEDELAELLPSGRQTTFANRVHWAKSYLGKAGLVEFTGRGRFRITDRGRSVLGNPPDRIDIKVLTRFQEFAQFRPDRANLDEPAQSVLLEVASSSATPDEAMRHARDALEADLGAELVERIRAAPPAFFEKLVVRLITAMGYGGSLADAGKALGRSGDGGVDGVIDEDALGLDRIYVQAKRYAADNPVGPGAVRDFFGALDQFKAGKGLFVTTSTFTQSATRTAEGLSKRIVLVDGQQLARLMIRYGVGCRLEETLYIKTVDEDFFEPA